MNSSIHSYMVLAYTDAENVSLNVGFYYMANAAGRLIGTLLSGAVFMLGRTESGGMQACLWTSSLLVLLAWLSSLKLPPSASSSCMRALFELNGQGRTLRLAAQALSEVVQPGAQAEFELRARDVYGRFVGRLILQGRDVGADLIRRVQCLLGTDLSDVVMTSTTFNSNLRRVSLDRRVWSFNGGPGVSLGCDGNGWSSGALKI